MRKSYEFRNKRNMILTFLLSLAVALLYMYDFYHMVTPEGVGNSDTKIQIGYILEWYETGQLPEMCQAYPLYYIVIRAIHHFIDNWVVVIMLFCSVWSFVANITQIIIIRQLISTSGEATADIETKSERYAVLAGTALSFAWPISTKYSFFLGDALFGCPLERVFLTSGATALDHNLTYLFVKPFALLAVYLFVRMLESDVNRQFLGNLVTFAIVLFVSVIAKPNFYQAFAPAGVGAVLVYLRRRGWGVLGRCVMIAVSYLPATIWVIWSMRYKLHPYAVSPFEGITIFGDGTPVVIVLSRAIVFCIFISCCCIVYRHRESWLEFGWLVYLFGAGEFLLLIEPAEPETLSMSGGYNISMYILFFTAIIAAWKLYAERRNKLLFGTGNTLLAVHSLLGVAVFVITWLPWWKVWAGF
ncbi:MAG: hypothetical protein IJS12_10530 [Lachnospiraceae bacterium]|nr:hypothetical protein [Lachnospiraceae bacterium]